MDSSLSTLEQLIPCSVGDCSEAKTYLHIVMQIVLKIVETLGSSLQNKDPLRLIMHKLIKIDDP